MKTEDNGSSWTYKRINNDACVKKGQNKTNLMSVQHNYANDTTLMIKMNSVSDLKDDTNADTQNLTIFK